MSKRMVVILAVVWMVILVAGVTTSLTLTLAGADDIPLVGRLTGGQEIVVTEEEYRMIARYARLEEVLSLIESEYYLETDEDQLILGAIQGMVSTLDDPYSYYCTPEEMSHDQQRQEGVYEGVGLQLQSGEDNRLMITRVFADSPAHAAGIRTGDVLVSAAGVELEPVEGVMDTAKALLAGELGTSVEVGVQRGEERLTFEVLRASVQINRVDSSMLDDDIGYIAIYEFMGDDVEGFTAALKARAQDGAKALIVDLRSNPGGLLSDVVEITDALLDEGLIVYVENRAGGRDSYYSDADSCALPLAVLVNRYSASASEILAGAVQDRGAGVILGETTYGKGIVQSIIPFHEDGAGLHLPTARSFTPSGRSIHGCGIEPDIAVEQAEGDEIVPDAPDPARDTQLREAVKHIRRMRQP